MQNLSQLSWAEFKTVEDAAKAAYAAACEDCRDERLNPDMEVALWSPEEARDKGFTNGWHLIWESGPYMWGVGTSMQTAAAHPPWGFCETYWGCDLIFNDEPV